MKFLVVSWPFAGFAAVLIGIACMAEALTAYTLVGGRGGARKRSDEPDAPTIHHSTRPDGQSSSSD